MGELSSEVSRCEADFNREKNNEVLKRQTQRSPRFRGRKKFALIKKIVGGLCCQCEGIPPKLSVMMWVIAQLIEKYCEKCFKKWKQREH